MDTASMQGAIIHALEDIKAKDIITLEVSKLSGLFEVLIIASADSGRQAKALAANVREKLKALGCEIIGMEGEESADWVLVDFGNIVVHIMQRAVRDYYNLEQLWGGEKPLFLPPVSH